MRDRVRPYAGETKPLERAKADAALDATYAQLEAQLQGQPLAATLWMQFHVQVRMAQIARASMRASDANQLQRDLAAVTYGRHCDLMMDLLDAMSEQQVLTDIGSMLNRRGR